MLNSYRQLFLSDPRPLIYGIMHTFFSGFGQTFFIALFIPELQKYYHLSHTHFGVIYSLATIVSASLIPYLGAWVDKVNLKKYSLSVNAGLIFGYVMLSHSRSILGLFISLFLIRLCGQALLPLISSTATGRYFHNFRGRALAVTGLGHPIGEAILPIILSFIIAGYGWNGAINFLIIINLIIFIPIILFLLPKTTPFLEPTLTTKKQLRKQNSIFTETFFFLMAPSLMAYPFVGTGMFFHQSTIANLNNWPLTWIIACFPLYATFRIIGTFLGGSLIDKWKACRLTLLPLFPLFLSLTLMSIFTTPWVIPFYMAGFGLAVGFSSCIYVAMWAEVYGTTQLGKIKSASRPFIIGSTALAPIVFGWVLDYGLGFTGIIIVCYTSVFIAIMFQSLSIVQNTLKSSIQ